MTEIYSDDDLLRIRESNKFLEMKIPSKVVERNVAISAAIETMKSKELTNENLIRDLREKVSTLEKQSDDSHMNAVILDLKRGKHMSDEDYRKKVSALEKRCIGTDGETDYAGFTGSTNDMSKRPFDITPRRTRSGSYHEPVDSRKFPHVSDKPLPVPSGLREKISELEYENVVKRGKTMSDEKFSSLEKSEKDYADFAGSTKLDCIINHKSKRTLDSRSESYHDCMYGPGNACMCPPASDKPLHTSAPFNRPPRYGQSIYSSAPRTVPPPLVPINNNFSSISNMFGCNCSRLKKCTCVDVKGYSSVTGDEAC